MYFPFQGFHSKLPPLEKKRYLHKWLCSNYNLLNLFIWAEPNSFLRICLPYSRHWGHNDEEADVLLTLLGLMVHQGIQTNNEIIREQGPGYYWSTWERHLGVREGSLEELTSMGSLCGHLTRPTGGTHAKNWNRVIPLGCGLQVCSPRTL